MSRLRPAGTAILALVAAGALACQEQLTQPGSCPELCPGGIPNVVEEVLTALPGLDSTFTGYVAKASNGVLLVSSGVPTPADTNLAVIAFAPRPDSVQFRDTLRAYTVDSVRLRIGLIARDSTVSGLQIQFYRLPSTLDTTSLTYPGASALFTPANLITSAPVSDTLRRGVFGVFLTGAALDRVALGPADGGRLVIGVSVVAPVPTGIRVGTAGTTVPPVFTTYYTPIVENTLADSLPIDAVFTSYVSPMEPPLDPNLLTIGGAPSSRALIRFPFPARLRDSASIVRATLELVPTQPVRGLPNDPGTLEANAVVADLGAKSPICFVSQVCSGVPIAAAGSALLLAGATDTVRLEVANQVLTWQGSPPAPPTLALRVTPEAATFSEAVFGSTRAGGAPRLRIEYLRKFPFQRP